MRDNTSLEAVMKGYYGKSSSYSTVDNTDFSATFLFHHDLEHWSRTVDKTGVAFKT